DAWKKVNEGVYTGFSQGGRKVGDMTPDPVYKGCMRYVANPSEVSLVDNPCLASAHFAYIKTDGAVEIRKFSKTEAPVIQADRITALEQEVELLKAASIHVVKGKTKRVAGEDLPSSAFAYVGDPDKTETWKLPIKFSSDAKTKSHIRNALARFNQTQGIPSGERARVHARIVAAAKKHGIDVSEEKEKLAATFTIMRKAVRRYINQRLDKVVSRRILDLDLRLGQLNKGMMEVSRMAFAIQDIVCLFHCICMEQEWEGDADSKQPAMLAENVESLIGTLLEMVDEETKEISEEVQAHRAVA